MKRLISLFALSPLLLGISLSAHAQTAQDSAAARPQVAGEIRKVDSAAGKLTIRHGDIPNLGMPAMTMVFRVATPALLNQVHSGDHVAFTADRIDGALTVMSIAPQSP